MLLLIGVFGRSPGTVALSGTPTPTPTTSTKTPSTVPTTSAPVVTSVPEVTPAPTTTTPTEPVPPSATTSVDRQAIEVVVLNATTEAGLAGRVSDYLAGLGWSTGEPGNFAAAAAVTTVYFPAGYEDFARALAAVAPGSGTTIAPVTPEVGADVVTVVLGQDAAGWTPPTQGT